MEQEKQTNPKNQYEVGTSFVFVDPEQASGFDAARELILSGLNKTFDNIKLETRMLVYDALHGTQYRQTRHTLVRDARNQAFEASIGLERTK